MKKLSSSRIEKIIEKTVRGHGIIGDYEVNVYEATEEEIRELDRKWMEQDGELHEVLSFPTEDGPGPDGVTRLGDIVVLGDLPADRHGELIAHACLHLLGVHHE